MGLDLDTTNGQTPLEEDEKEGLLITTITTRGELDEFEQLGVEKAIEWTRKRTFGFQQILTEEFVRELHRRMFEGIWKWAGQFRVSNKNLGVDKNEIRSELKKLLDDCHTGSITKYFPGMRSRSGSAIGLLRSTPSQTGMEDMPALLQIFS
jgi:fido (protein-threonine AMPylation protein)